MPEVADPPVTETEETAVETPPEATDQAEPEMSLDDILKSVGTTRHEVLVESKDETPEPPEEEQGEETEAKTAEQADIDAKSQIEALQKLLEERDAELKRTKDHRSALQASNDRKQAINDRDMDAMRRELDELKGKLASEQPAAPSPDAEASQISALQKELKQAVTDGDMAAALEAQDKINDIKTRKLVVGVGRKIYEELEGKTRQIAEKLPSLEQYQARQAEVEAVSMIRADWNDRYGSVPWTSDTDALEVVEKARHEELQRVKNGESHVTEEQIYTTAFAYSALDDHLKNWQAAQIRRLQELAGNTGHERQGAPAPSSGTHAPHDTPSRATPAPSRPANPGRIAASEAARDLGKNFADIAPSHELTMADLTRPRRR